MADWRDIPGNLEVFKQLEQQLRGGEAIAFVGAGASAPLYPSWSTLIHTLGDAVASRLDVEELELILADAAKEPQRVVAELRRHFHPPGDYLQTLAELFAPRPGPDGRYHTATHAQLMRLAFQGYVTTNYDHGLHSAHRAERPSEPAASVVTPKNEAAFRRWRADGFSPGQPILSLHGSWDDAESLVLDIDDYRRAYVADSVYRQAFRSLWTDRHLVFVGFGFSDPWLQKIVDHDLTSSRDWELSKPRHIAILSAPEADLGKPVLVRYHRRRLEGQYHARVLFYPVITVREKTGSRQDHSALGEVLAALLAELDADAGAAPAEPSDGKAVDGGQRDAHAILLGHWFDQVIRDHRRLGDHFERPGEMAVLEEAWVELEVQPAGLAKVARAGLDEGGAEEGETFEKVGPEKAGQRFSLEQALQLDPSRHPWVTGRWLLAGPPGSGKTTLLRHFASSLAQEGDARRIPLFVSLPRLVGAGQSHLLPFAASGLQPVAGVEVTAVLEAAGAQGRLVVLLDGLDEVPSEQRDAVHRLLGWLQGNWGGCPLVVSSRPLGRGELPPGFPLLRLLPLEPARRKEFLRRWFAAAEDPDPEATAKLALARFEAQRSLRELAGIPLYLTLLAVLWQQERLLPERPVELYDEILALLLEGKHKRRPKAIPAQEDVREALCHLAHGMTEDDCWAEPRGRLERRLRHRELAAVRQQLETVGPWRNDLQRFLQDVYERTQILGPHDDREGDWRFWHRSFREALTAEHLHGLYREAGEDALLGRFAEVKGDLGRWAEPLSLLAGRLSSGAKKGEGEAADGLVVRLAEVNPALGVRAVATARELRAETLDAVLRLTDDLEERAKVFEGIPEQLGAAGPCLALVERLGERRPGGFDLFWLDWILDQVEARWPAVSGRARQVRKELFAPLGTPDARLFHEIVTPHDGRVELWREIPAGVGWIGSPESEEGRYGDEGPRHRVEITHPFWLAAVPVTNAQYACFDPAKPFEPWEGVPKEELQHHPRVNVSWYEAMAFCRWLSTFPGFVGVRLPTEEEWEFACRAGTESRYWKGDAERALGKVGWYDKNSDDRTHRVGEKEANPWDLYDLHGNVWEWTVSAWKGNYTGQADGLKVDSAEPPADLAGSPGVDRVNRGGSFWYAARSARSAFRFRWDPGFEFRVRGFRLLLPRPPSGL